MRVAGKVAVVTGAAQGIGRGIAHRLAEEGARVVVADIQDERGEQTTAELTGIGAQAVFVRTDVTRAEDIERAITQAVERFGRLDVLVNNAFWNKQGTAVDLSLEDWNRAMSAMVTASFLGAKYAVPRTWSVPAEAPSSPSRRCTASWPPPAAWCTRRPRER